MFGLVILCIAALYLALMLFVVSWAWRKGRADGGSIRKGVLFAVLGFLVVYLPVFGSYIPVLLKHRYLCAKDAGFTVYVPKEQWAAQHREAIDRLTKEEVSRQERSAKSEISTTDFRRRAYFGGLLINEWQGRSYKVLNLRIRRGESRILDAQTNQVMAAYINYGARIWPPDNPIGWIFPDSCFDVTAKENPKEEYFKYSSGFNFYLKENVK